jgi:phage shock protein A
MSLASWLRRVFAFLVPPEENSAKSPVEIFEDAVRGARQRFLDLRAGASPLYASREALHEQEKARAGEVAELGAKAAALLKEGREKEALELAGRQGRVEGDLERIRKELADLAVPIGQVEARLRKIEAEVRDLERERDRSAALIRSAEARVAVDRIMAQHASVDGPDLSEARYAVAAKLEQARALEQVSASSTAAQLEALEGALEEDSARARLEGIRAAAALPPGQDVKKEKPL